MDELESEVPVEGHVGWVTGSVEMFFYIFRQPSYSCWKDTCVDAERNPHAWGYDQFLRSACGSRIGLIHKYTITHKGPFVYNFRAETQS